MKLVILVGLMACGPVAKPKTSTALPPSEAQNHGREALLSASGHVDAIEKLMQGGVTNGGMWFDDAACATQFSQGGVVSPSQVHAFAQCVSTLQLQPSVRKDKFDDVVVMTYQPGIEVEARVIGNHLSWIGFEARRPIDAMLPTITSAALESIRLTGTRNGPLDPSVASTLELEARSKSAFAWIRICLDESGTVTLAHPFEMTSLKASAAFEAAARAWTFKPFMVGTRAVAICSMVRMSYPPDSGPIVQSLPLPPPETRSHVEPYVLVGSVASKKTEERRLAGSLLIAPDGDTKKKINDSNVVKLVGSFRICLDETGAVESTLQFRSTGFPDYDRELESGMHQWRYLPYLVEGRAVPVCSDITFIYSQR